MGIVDHPEILKALSPTYALSFMFGHFHIAFFALAAVVLAVTGAEALYADMGHFGRRPITLAWLFIVLPACVLNYFGQGALIIGDEKQVSAPFFLLIPELGAAADGVARHRGHHHRVAGGDHRRVLGRRAGRETRPAAAAADRAHLGVGLRPGLRSRDQLDVDGVGADPGVRLRELGQARLRLRHGGDRHHHHRHAAVLLPRQDAVGHAALDGRDRRRRPAARRPAVPGGQPDQAGARRVAAAADRRRGVDGHDDVGAWPQARHQRRGSRPRARCPSSSTGSPTTSRPCRGSPAPRYSSTAARRRRRWRCAPTSNTATCATTTS